MAITKKGGPQDFTPVYNPVNIYVDSTNKTKPSFRYVFDLYKVGTPTKIAETRGAPRPGDGYGISKLSKLLAPLVTRKFDPTELGTGSAEENYIRYELKVGEEFKESWAYSDYEYYGNPLSIYNGYTKLRQFSTTGALAHNYQVGDQITIVQNDGGATKPILTGLHTIVEIVDSWTVVIELTFAAVGSGPTIGGQVSYADGRRTITRNLLTIKGVAYNGAFTVPDFRVYNSSNYLLDAFTGSKNLLTTMPEQGLKIKDGADAWINFAQADETNFATYAYFENSNGDVFRKPILGALAFIRQFYAGTDSSGLGAITGTAPLVKANTEYYSFWIAGPLGQQTTKKYRFEIDRRCVIEDFEVLFEDRLGSFLPFAFQLRADKKTQVKRTEYLSELGDRLFHADPEKVTAWGHESYAEGMTTVNVEQDKDYDLRTNWMNRTEAEYYEEFVSAPNHLVKLDGLYYSCKLKTLQTTTQGVGTKKLVRKDLTIRLSNQDPINI